MRDFPLRANLPDRLETDRLVLRAPDRRDVAAMARLANNEKIHAMTTLPFPYAVADAVEFVDHLARTDDEHAYSIVLRTGDLIGTIGLHLKGNAPPELGYWVGEPYWGNGYATEAASSLVAAVLASGWVTLLAKSRAENAGSRTVLERAGFVLISEAIGQCGPYKGVPLATYRIGQPVEPVA